jgi:acyl-coenzyme A synthetase/AMP-(fatty) acid ligase
LKKKSPDCDNRFVNNNLKNEIIKNVENAIGKFARPKKIRFVTDLPKTRTGKLVRRLIKAKLSNNIEDQDLSTIENPESLDKI